MRCRADMLSQNFQAYEVGLSASALQSLWVFRPLYLRHILTAWLQLASVSYGAIWLWGDNSGDCIGILKGYPSSVAFSTDDSKLACALEDGTLRLWHGNTGLTSLPSLGFI